MGVIDNFSIIHKTTSEYMIEIALKGNDLCRYRMNCTLFVLLCCSLLIAILSPAAAHPPRSLIKEIQVWLKLVQIGNVDLIADRICPGEVLIIRTRGNPSIPREFSLTRGELRKRLRAGQANVLGLSKQLLLPRIEDVRMLGKERYSVTNLRCPEVTWIFGVQDGRWCLLEIVRSFLEC
jgi:hypothetical protein